MTLTDSEWQTIRDMISTSVQTHLQRHLSEWHNVQKNPLVQEWKEDAKWREHLEDTGYIKELEEKAAKWDDIDSSVNTYVGNYNEVRQWKEKAAKWDEHEKEFNDVYHIPKDLWNEKVEKAAKWDEHFFSLYTDITINDIKEWKEKAKKYDENARLITLFGHLNDSKTLTELQEKADKWDEYKDLVTKYGKVENLKELEEKAKRLDNLISAIDILLTVCRTDQDKDEFIVALKKLVENEDLMK
jgi:hypothetical protein